MKFTALIMTALLIPVASLAGGGGGLRPTKMSVVQSIMSGISPANLGGNNGTINSGVSPHLNIKKSDTLIDYLRSTENPEIVFRAGTGGGVVRFGYGALVNKQWQVESVEIQDTQLNGYPELVKALRQSAEVRDWVPLKN